MHFAAGQRQSTSLSNSANKLECKAAPHRRTKGAKTRPNSQRTSFRSFETYRRPAAKASMPLPANSRKHASLLDESKALFSATAFVVSAKCCSGRSVTACLGHATIAPILEGKRAPRRSIKGCKMVDHETRRKIIRQWMLLPKDKRQTPEQAADFARKAVEQNELQPSRRDPYVRVVGWLLPRTGRSHTFARRQG